MSSTGYDHTTANNLTLRQAALFYATYYGRPVFPCRPGGKEPLVRWTEQATTDPDQIKLWWDIWPDANIGLPMGDGWHALDLDQGRHEEDGVASYRAIGGAFPILQPIQRTPSGGMHILFQSEDTFKNFTRRGPHGGIDMRSDRGYILAAPSVVGGVPYRWVAGHLEVMLPRAVEDKLYEWSCARQGGATGATGDFPLVEPSLISEEDALWRIGRLGKVHEAFLLHGITDTGDQSKDAYRAAYHAFRHGWTLADMAAIGPLTTLATFGAEPPHSAANPWGWCWRYTIKAAWLAAQAQGPMFEEIVAQTRGDQRATKEEAPGEGASSSCLKEEKATITQPGGPSTSLAAEIGSQSIEPASTFEQLKVRAETLQMLDLRAAQGVIEEALRSELPAVELETLLQVCKQFSGLSVAVLREHVKEIRRALHARQAQERAQQRQQTGEKSEEVFVRDQGRMLDRVSGNLISLEAFRTDKARECGGDVQRVMEMYVTGEHAVCERVESLTYDPGLPPGSGTDHRGVAVYNTYRPSALMETHLRLEGGQLGGGRAGVGPWITLLDSLHLEKGPQGEDMREELLDRLAFLVQRPGEKFNHGILIGGKHGIGKDSFLEPIIRAVGRHNTNHIHGDELSGDFTAWQAGCKLLVLNELDYGSRRDKRRVSELLKPALAAPPVTLRVNEKNLRPYDVPNRLQCVGFSNHRDCLHLDRGERRWLALWCEMDIGEGESRAQWDAWFENYWAWLDAGGDAAVLSYLMARDIRAFKPGARPIRTPWLEEMTEASMSDLEAWVAEGLRERTGIWQLPVIDGDVLAFAVRQVAGLRFGGRVPNLVYLGRALSSFGIPRKQSKWGRWYYWLKNVGGPVSDLDFQRLANYKRAHQIKEGYARGEEGVASESP